MLLVVPLVVVSSCGGCQYRGLYKVNVFSFHLIVIAGPVIDKTKQSTILLKIMTPLMFSTYVALIFVGMWI